MLLFSDNMSNILFPSYNEQYKSNHEQEAEKEQDNILAIQLKDMHVVHSFLISTAQSAWQRWQLVKLDVAHEIVGSQLSKTPK